MNILFFTMSMKCGGAERVISSLANHYSGIGSHVTIMTCLKGKSYYKVSNKIDTVSLDDCKQQQDEHKISRFLRRRTRIKMHLLNNKYDVIICFLPEPSFLMLSLKKHFKLKILVSERANPKEEYSNLFHSLLMRMLYPRADSFVFQTEDAKKYFSHNIRKKSTVIPNSISQDFLNMKPGNRQKKEIVSVGRLHKQKNHELLIEAFNKIHFRYPDYILKIYGNGELKEALYNRICELKLEEYIFLMGDTNDVKGAIQNASLFVLPSDSEGMPNALMEAMAIGLPVISTDCPCGGPRQMIIHEVNGLLTRVGDVKDLTESILKLLDNPELANQLGQNAQKVVDTYHPDKIYSKWNQAIVNCINETSWNET